MTHKIALITGGTSGMGAATAKRFHEEGATVIVTGSSKASVEAARKAMPYVEAIASDAGDSKAAKTLVDHIKEKYGHLNILFVNAGIAKVAPLSAADEAHFDELFRVNVRGPYFLLKYAVPAMTDGGSIILTSSMGALKGMPGLSVYSATKAALRSFGLTLAAELASRRIRVNTITPGPISTPIAGKMGLSPEQIAGFGQMVANGPLGRPGDRKKSRRPPCITPRTSRNLRPEQSCVSTAASRRFDLGHEELSAFGGTAKELSEVLLHLTVYCGFPAVLSGFRVLQAIKAEISSVK